MTARILDGKAIADQIRHEIAMEIRQGVAGTSLVPCLAAILVGDDPASQVYVRNKERACASVGIQSRVMRFPYNLTTESLLETIDGLNADPLVHGILVQLPLPATIETQRVLDRVDPLKDVDAFAPENVGLLCQGRPRFLPCTPHGIVQLLARSEISVQGKEVVVVGRSDIVGKPIGLMLLQKSGACGPSVANASVTFCHSQSHDLASITRRADVLIVAIGKANFLRADMVKHGAVIIDVGINRVESGLVGDVDFEGVRPIASAITPVPGGIGPLTIAMLLKNTWLAAQYQQAR